jgi:glucokinase-like ROK family protein
MVGQQARSSGARHVVMRELNRSLVLDLIKKHSPISRAGLATASSLAKPTVSVIVEELLERGIVREIGVGSTTREGGRPPVLLEFDALSQVLAGVHVGVTTTTIVLADALGVEFHRVVMPTGRGRADKALARIAKAVEGARRDAGVEGRELAVGVCVPGLTDLTTGVCLLAPNLGWREVPVRDILHAALGAPVYVHNSAQAAAVAEVMEGVARGADDVVLLYLGSGIGSGLMSAGRLFSGSTGLAGEVGHCPVEGSDEPCPCGRTGCLEAVASGIAIARDAERAVAGGRSTALADMGTLTVESVTAAAMAGDAVAIDLLETAGRHLGVAASWLLNLINPEVLVLAGGMVAAGEPLLSPLLAATSEHVLPQVGARVDIRRSELGADAEVRGAVLLAMQFSETYYRVVFQGA